MIAAHDDHGNSLPLFSTDAFHAEFRYLRTEFQKTDLSGSAVKTDGWNYNIAEAEWPFMAFCYFGYACANFAECVPTIRDDALVEMRWVIEALQTPRLSGFVTPHFGEPFGTNEIHTAVFVHGHFLNLALKYREISSDTRYDPMIERVAAAIIRDYLGTDQSVLRSYRDMRWLTDNFPACAALVRYDHVFKHDSSAARNRFLASLKTYYLDRETGLFCTYINPNGPVQIQGARGISVMYGLHFLRDFDPEFAAGQYALAGKLLVRKRLGVTFVREFPEGASDRADIDSGPLILGAGPSASGFAIAAAAINGDTETAWQLAAAVAVAGLPYLHGGELRYTAMPPVGQAVILFGKSELMKLDGVSSGK